MARNILLTGVSGYLGGSLLAHVQEAGSTGTIFALVRTSAQADEVRRYGATPLSFDPNDANAVSEAIAGNKISIVFYLIGCDKYDNQGHFLAALAKHQDLTGETTHFLFTTGTKQFGSHAGAPTNQPFFDDDPQIYDIHKAQRCEDVWAQTSVNLNISVVDQGEQCGVKTYIFSPCMVYGKGEGFGNVISIQTVDIVRAAKAAGQVFDPQTEQASWPVCHIQDTTNLYLCLLRQILRGENPSHGKNGFYLASSGSVAWLDVYSAMAQALAKRGIIADATVTPADDVALAKMAEALKTTPASVPIRIAGKCTYAARHGLSLGWTPQFKPGNILEAAGDEVEWILQHLE